MKCWGEFNPNPSSTVYRSDVDVTIDEKRNPFPITSVKFCTRIPFIDDSKCRDLMLQYAQYARQQAGFKLVDSANK